jgi:hypothetical protein
MTIFSTRLYQAKLDSLAKNGTKLGMKSSKFPLMNAVCKCNTKIRLIEQQILDTYAGKRLF